MFPYLFKIGSFELRIYSLMYLLAVVTAIFLIKKRGKLLGLLPEKLENGLLISFFGGILGARFYYVALKWDFYSQYPKEILAFWHGGLAIHGGIIGGMIAAYLYSKKEIGFFKFTDIVAPTFLLGQGIGRFGNFANGEAHGVPIITPPSLIFKMQNIFPEFWGTVINTFSIKNTPEGMSSLDAVIKNSTSVSVQFQGHTYLLKEYFPWGISFPAKYFPPAYQEFGTLPVHPTFFYEMILNFIGAAIIFFFWRKDKNIGHGLLSGLYLIFYGLIRAFVTMFRADDLMLGTIRAPHIASLVMVIIGSILVYRGYLKKALY